MRITRTSPFSGMTTQRDLNVTPDQLTNWLEGILVQRVWPFLPKGDREFIMTGTTDQEWDTDTAAWRITEYIPEDDDSTIVLLDPDCVEDVIELIAQYNPIKPIRYLSM